MGHTEDRADAGHHLRPFFRRELVRIVAGAGALSQGTIDYLSDLLSRFARTANLFPLDRRGEAMVAVADILAEAAACRGLEGIEGYDPFQEARWQRHLGDYTLFTAGLFREWVERRASLRFYCDVGRDAYHRAADFEAVLDRRRARLFAELSETFEACVAALEGLRQGRFGGAYDLEWPVGGPALG
ncbi:MAG: hypothetical protein D6739_03850 [Nitrospirae bacterium]|nr:MAG: hypothetical protein D6739_03850 [Nitrospirota bacterium]